MKTTTNYLILNQACADLYRTLMELIHITNHLIGGRWVGGLLGLITCKLFLVGLFIPLIFSVWILATIAVDRFYAVSRPLRSSPLSRHFKKVIVFLWTWSLVCSLEVLIKGRLSETKEHYSCSIIRFLEQWITFYIVTVSLNVLLPLLMTAVLYIIVCHKLWSRKVPGEGISQNQRQAEALKTARKVTVMMVTVEVLYVLCFSPFFIGSTLHFLGYVGEDTDKLYLSLFLIAFAYSGLNPYVYLTFNQKFRNGFKTCFKNCFRKSNI